MLTPAPEWGSVSGKKPRWLRIFNLAVKPALVQTQFFGK